MTTDTDPRVRQAMRLNLLYGGNALQAYLAAEFAKVPRALDDHPPSRLCDCAACTPHFTQPCGMGSSAPVEAVPRHRIGFMNGVLPASRMHELWNEAEPTPSGQDPMSRFTWQLSVFAESATREAAALATTPPQAGKTENEIDRLETEVARLTAELSCTQGAYDTAAIEVERLAAELEERDRLLRSSVPERLQGQASPVAAVQGYIFELQDELQEVRKDAAIHRGGERPSVGWYWMRWDVDSPSMSPWTILNTFPGPVGETTEWVGPLKAPEAPKP